MVFAEYPLAGRRGGERSWGKISAAARVIADSSAWMRLSLPL
jgi:hypothetical protein